MTDKEEKVVTEDNTEAVETSDEEIAVEEPIVIENKPSEDETQKKINEYKDIAQRLQAEFDNYRKRNNESVRVARNDGINDVVIALFPILDNFERGLAAIEDEAVKSGMELIYKQTVALLNKFDVEEIDALGKEFDPKLHHAIAQCEEEGKTDIVVEVYQKGYKRKDKVLRPSMVKVAR